MSPADIASDAPILIGPSGGATFGTVCRVIVDGANGREGAFQSLPEAMRQVFQRNVRVLAPFFSGPPPPRLTAKDIEAIDIPTTLTLGDGSRTFWQICVPEIARRMPSARLLRGADRQHMWPAEAPDDFSRLIIDVLGSSAGA